MSSILVELTANIVSSHASTVEMTSDELLKEISMVFQALKNLENNTDTEVTASDKPTPVVSPKKSIQKDQVICLICGKEGFKSLTRHLRQSHNMKPGEYRKQVGLPPGTALVAKNYSEARRQAAIKNNLNEVLAKGREKRMANFRAKNSNATATVSKTKKVVAAKPKKAVASTTKKAAAPKKKP